MVSMYYLNFPSPFSYFCLLGKWFFLLYIFLLSLSEFFFLFLLFFTFYFIYFRLFRDPEDRMRLGQHFGRKLGLERRDVWDMLWSEDDEELLCIVEKTKMVRLFD